MPWSARDADRHIKGLSSRQKKAWSEIANNALQEYGDEGRAIRTANAKVKKVGRGSSSKSRSRTAKRR